MGLVLSKDEVLQREDTFTTNLVLFWLKTDFSLTSKRVMGHAPNTFLGMIPLGKSEFTYPLKNIAGIAASTKFHFVRLLVGLILVFAGFGVFDSSFIGAIILILLGLSPLANCYTSTFVITNNAGEAPIIELSILEKDKVAEFVGAANAAIAEL